jgi:hypothetical protein
MWTDDISSRDRALQIINDIRRDKSLPPVG